MYWLERKSGMPSVFTLRDFHSEARAMSRFNRPFAALTLALALATTLPADAETLTGRVVKVTDGDTVQVLDASRNTHKVRLAGIDAPESGQAFGTKAKRRLLALVGGKTVTVDWDKRDRYRRLVGKLLANGDDINLAMVRDGMAWWYRKYADEQSATDRRRYAAAEERARSARRGLWSDPNAMAPWGWRDRPAPADSYARECPCVSTKVCTGKRGGRFCVRENGSKKYFPRGE